MRARWLLVAAVFLALLGAAILWLAPARQSEPLPVAGTKLFEQVLSKVRSAAVEPVEEQELYRRAAAGMIDELEDPYAVLLLPGEESPPPDDAPVGPGLYLDRRDGLVVVVATVPGSPAARAGVEAGDRILVVDSTIADPTRLDRLMSAFTGPPGTRFELRVRRSGIRSPLSLEVIRGVWQDLPVVESASLGSGVGRIRINRFIEGIADTVKRRLVALRAEGARSLVLDLRAAVGGALQEGVALADLFLERGKTIALSRGRPAGASASYRDSAASDFATMPLAVLIDEGTAGAAEVVAGALQDHDRAAVLGQHSFGRGVTRSSFRLGAGASLSLTTALWITPSGRQIQQPPRSQSGDTLPRPKVKSDGGRVLLGGGGIAPDRRIERAAETDLVLAEARRMLMRAGSPEEVLALLPKQE